MSISHQFVEFVNELSNYYFISLYQCLKCFIISAIIGRFLQIRRLITDHFLIVLKPVIGELLRKGVSDVLFMKRGLWSISNASDWRAVAKRRSDRYKSNSFNASGMRQLCLDKFCE